MWYRPWRRRWLWRRPFIYRRPFFGGPLLFIGLMAALMFACMLGFMMLRFAAR